MIPHRDEQSLVVVLLQRAPVDDEEVLPPIVVVVHERGPPPDEGQRHLSQAVPVRLVHEHERLGHRGTARPNLREETAVQGILLSDPVGHEDVTVTVVVPVTPGDGMGVIEIGVERHGEGAVLVGREVDRDADGIRDAFYEFDGDSLVRERGEEAAFYLALCSDEASPPRPFSVIQVPVKATMKVETTMK